MSAGDPENAGHSANRPASDDIVLDPGRAGRIGLGEAIYCAGKTVAHIEEIIRQARLEETPYLLTRLATAQHSALAPEVARALDYDPLSETAVLGMPRRGVKPQTECRIGIVAAGTSDASVAREAERTLRFYGEPSVCVTDVGVAGLHRLTARIDTLRRLPVLIAVAGMDAALVSVLGGLVSGVVIAVPTSVGYGAARGGETALAASLASCASGVVVCNIDNGFGAACAALRMCRAIDGAVISD
ncbi:MAG: nickel pincer cofactor biosynthesis protein LarB [Pseudomonadota bacterium]